MWQRYTRQITSLPPTVPNMVPPRVLCNLLGTPETSLRGRRTLMALRVLRSTPSSSLSPVAVLSVCSAGEMSAMYLGRVGQALHYTQGTRTICAEHVVWKEGWYLRKFLEVDECSQPNCAFFKGSEAVI